MKKNLLSLFFVVALFASLGVNAQTTIDISAINEDYTTTYGPDLVLDVSTVASAAKTPLLKYDNPFKDKTLTDAEISFDVNNYLGTDSLKVLGSLFAIFDTTLGRMYFSNGSYLGYNATAGFFDVNLINYGLGNDYLSGTVWRSVKLQFTKTGFAMYVDNVLAFDESSTDVTITKGNGFVDQYDSVLYFLENASSLVFGTGSFWSDNMRDDGSYWDVQYCYLKNITFTPNFTSASAIAENKLSSEIKVYNKYGQLQFVNVEAKAHIEVYNLLGKTISTGSRYDIEGHSFSAGVYIVKVTTGNVSISQKVLIRN